MDIWIVTVNSESCDDYGAFCFSHKPTDKQLEEFFRKELPHEWPDEESSGEGPGRWGSYLHVSAPYQAEIITLT